MKKLKGSLSIEAALTVSIMLIVFTFILGALISIYIDENMQWSILQTKDDLSLAYMPYIGHDQFEMKKVEQTLLSALAEYRLYENITYREMDQLVRKTHVRPIESDDLGFLSLSVSYQYTMPSIINRGALIIPTVAAAFSDGVDFDHLTVYITTYGEKYHKTDCFHLRKSKFGISLADAKSKGYEACKNCHKHSQKED